MRKCKCYSCGYTWLLSHGQNGHGRHHTCPKCDSDKIQFVLEDMVRDLQAGLFVTNPALLCLPTGSRTGYSVQKWMTD
jgi:hypothetical protein